MYVLNVFSKTFDKKIRSIKIGKIDYSRLSKKLVFFYRKCDDFRVEAVYFIDVTKRLRITTFSLSFIYLENAVKRISQGGDHKMRTQKNITRWGHHKMGIQKNIKTSYDKR